MSFFFHSKPNIGVSEVDVVETYDKKASSSERNKLIRELKQIGTATETKMSSSLISIQIQPGLKGELLKPCIPVLMY